MNYSVRLLSTMMLVSSPGTLYEDYLDPQVAKGVMVADGACFQISEVTTIVICLQ